MSNCALRSLENPMLMGLLLGLDYRDGILKSRPELFPCCAGRGERYIAAQELVKRCQLSQRYGAVQDLLACFNEIWGSHGQAPPHQVNAEVERQLLAEAAGTLKGHQAQANIHYSSHRRASVLWPIAIAASWRFGAKVHFRNAAFHTHLLPSEHLMRGHEPLAIFIEQVGPLGEGREKQSYDFEALVNFAYSSNSFLWIEFIHQPKPSADSNTSGSSLRNDYSRRIAAAKVKVKDPLSHLSQSCRSILDQLSRLPRVAYEPRSFP